MTHIAAPLIYLDKTPEVSFCKASICQKQLWNVFWLTVFWGRKRRSQVLQSIEIWTHWAVWKNEKQAFIFDKGSKIILCILCMWLTITNHTYPPHSCQWKRSFLNLLHFFNSTVNNRDIHNTLILHFLREPGEWGVM